VQHVSECLVVARAATFDLTCNQANVTQVKSAVWPSSLQQTLWGVSAARGSTTAGAQGARWVTWRVAVPSALAAEVGEVAASRSCAESERSC